MRRKPLERKVNLAELGGPVYVGRDRGALARKIARIDELDDVKSEVLVDIPADTYTVSSSFFLGMFGNSIVRFRTRDAFFAHYRFTGPERIVTSLASLAARALREQGQLRLS
jgi:hypothetical protein